MSLPVNIKIGCVRPLGRQLQGRTLNLMNLSRRNICLNPGTALQALSMSAFPMSMTLTSIFGTTTPKFYLFNPSVQHKCSRHLQTSATSAPRAPLSMMPRNYDYLCCADDATRSAMMMDMLVYENFITEDEEKSLLNEVEPYLKRLRYEVDHWDNAIHGYRETERRNWNEANMSILERVRTLAFPPGVEQIAFVHVLDLTADGVIKPHVDSVRFCGDTIAGLSLMSSSIMRLKHEQDKHITADFLLSRRSLYIMRASARYNYSHEVLAKENSYFKGEKFYKGRRISIICRNQPTKE